MFTAVTRVFVPGHVFHLLFHLEEATLGFLLDATQAEPALLGFGSLLHLPLKREEKTTFSLKPFPLSRYKNKKPPRGEAFRLYLGCLELSYFSNLKPASPKELIRIQGKIGRLILYILSR
jgi:hypothetical protein